MAIKKNKKKSAPAPHKSENKNKRQENPAPAAREPETKNSVYHHDVSFYDRRIITLVTKSPEFVDWWIESQVGQNAVPGLVVGLCVLVDPPDRGGGDDDEEEVLQSVTAIQLCIDNYCLIYHSIRKESYTNTLKNFFQRKEITFVGVKQESQLSILRGEARFRSEMSPYEDLHYVAAHSYSRPAVPDEDCLAALVMEAIRNIDLVRPQPEGSWDQHVEYSSIRVYMIRLLGWLLLTDSRENPKRVTFRENREDRSIHKLYEVEIFDRTILTTVTKRLVVVEMWMDKNMNNGLVEHRYVGFDAELVTVDDKPRIGTVQFCVDSSCLIILFDQMNPRYLPRLEKFLLQDKNVFVGIDIERKMGMLKDMLLFAHGGPLNYIDLGKYAEWDRLAEDCIGIQVERPDVVADWDCPLLSVEQVKCALIDAALPYEVVRRVRASAA